MERCLIITVHVPYADGADYVDEVEQQRLAALVLNDVKYTLDEDTDAVFDTKSAEITTRND
jgi:hypothetical protein